MKDVFLTWLNESMTNYATFLTLAILLISSIATLVIHICSTRFGKISKLNEEITKLKTKNNNLTSELSELKNLEKIDQQMQSASDGDYLVWKEKSLKVCPACWYHDKKVTPIQTSSMDGSYQCSRCNHNGILNQKQHQLVMSYMISMVSNKNS